MGPLREVWTGFSRHYPFRAGQTRRVSGGSNRPLYVYFCDQSATEVTRKILPKSGIAMLVFKLNTYGPRPTTRLTSRAL